MVKLKILRGKKAGDFWVARRFPVRIGRAAAADLRLEEDGVWDRHLLLDFDRAKGFILSAEAEALASLNGQPMIQSPLRNGDVIELGAARLQFWLAETRQGGLRFREGLVWAMVAAISLVQVALIYWLLNV